jgi:hypothetical protein
VSTAIIYDVTTDYTYLPVATSTVLVRDIEVPISLADVKASYPQTFAVSFQSNNANKGGTPVHTYGNPGYRRDAPLRVGTRMAKDGKVAIDVNEAGINLPTGGECGKTNDVRSKILFPYDVTSSACYVRLTAPELQALCATYDVALIMLKNVTGSLMSIDSIARIANAGSANPADWISVQVSKDLSGVTTSAIPMPYDNIARRCDNILNGVQWTFVIARAGADYNPMDVIVGAKLDPLYGSVTYNNRTSWHSGTTKVWIHHKVRFVRYSEEERTTDEVSMPSLVPEVDKDLFYPFRLPLDKDYTYRE